MSTALAAGPGPGPGPPQCEMKGSWSALRLPGTGPLSACASCWNATPLAASHWRPTGEPSSLLNRGPGGAPRLLPAAPGMLTHPAVYLLSAVHSTSQALDRMLEKVCKRDTCAHCTLQSRRGSHLGVAVPPEVVCNVWMHFCCHNRHVWGVLFASSRRSPWIFVNTMYRESLLPQRMIQPKCHRHRS